MGGGGKGLVTLAFRLNMKNARTRSQKNSVSQNHIINVTRIVRVVRTLKPHLVQVAIGRLELPHPSVEWP